MNRDESRYGRGRAQMREIFGPDVETAVNARATSSPDLTRYLVEFPFGDIYTRPSQDPKNREMLRAAALTVLGYAQGELKEHIQGALHVGCSHEEVLEIILQMVVYAGFPAALEAAKTAAAVFAESTGSGEEA